MLHIAVLIVSYNRSAITVRGLQSLFSALDVCSGISSRVFLVDDNSPDGTGDLVRRNFPDIHVIAGTGSLYWNRGMALAYDHARASGPFDAYLLFNDDVVAHKEAFARMVAAFVAENRDRPTTITGALISPTTGKPTFGGVRSRGDILRVFGFDQLAADGELQECDTLQGNCVLVPAADMDAVGGLDRHYHHAYGDIDLGYALKRRGCRILLSREPVGYCERDQPWKPRLSQMTFRQRLQTLYMPPDPAPDIVHFVFKQRSPLLALTISTFYVLRRFWHVLAPPVSGATTAVRRHEGER